MIRRRLRFKFNCAVIAVCVGVSVLFGGTFLYLDKRYYRTSLENVQQFLESAAKQRRFEIAYLLYSRQEQALLESLGGIAAFDNVLGVRAYDKDGNAAAEMIGMQGLALREKGGAYGGQGTEPLLLRSPTLSVGDIEAIDDNAAFRRMEMLGAPVGSYLYALRSPGTPTQGYLEIFYDLSDIQQNSRWSLLLLGLTLAAMVFSLVLLLNALLSSLVLQPVEVLSNAMNRVREGAIGLRVQSSSKDEIGEMADAFNDMSEKLEAKQDSIMVSEAKYRSLFENAVEGLFRATMDGRILSANPAMARILGYPSPDALMSEVHAFEHSCIVDEGRRQELNAQLKLHGYVQDFEQRVRRRSGEVIWVAESVRVAPGPDGKALFLEGSLVDITERKRAEDLEHEKILAEAQSRAKSEFLAAMSHEIRTPMNAILGMTDLAMASGLTPRQWEYMQTVKDSAFHLLTVINDILDLSKIEAGRLELEPVDFDLEELVDAIAKSMAYQARKKGLELYRSLDIKAPRILQGDPARLRQVLLNLVGNAIKFTDTGRVVIRVNLVTTRGQVQPGPGGRSRPICLSFSVQDTGIGVPQDKQQHIFDSFTQAEGSTTSRRYGGTGLGLAISRQLVNLMGGDISLKSAIGKGSTFTFTACFGEGDPESVHKEDSLLAEWGERRGALNILLVEDNPLNVKVAELHLKRMGHNVLVADNGQHALEIMRTMPANAFDIVLMDLEMPVMDGFEATRQIRGADSRRSEQDAGPNPHVPIIAMTAHALMDVKEKCLDVGMNDFVPKPVNFADLSAAIQRAIFPDIEDVARVGRLNEGRPKQPSEAMLSFFNKDSAAQPDAEQPVVNAPVAQDSDAPPLRQAREQLSARPESGDASPVLDKEAAIRTLGIDAALFEPIFENSLREVRTLYDRMHDELAAEDYDAIVLSAHTSKSTAATMGAMEYREHAVLVEQAARTRDGDTLAPRIIAMGQALERLEARVAGDSEV
ncbi:ATP-binding protein [Oceanidesulfovibrio indonesiensis]|nr:ATP-binding protein [Oceanidesulfovibrio indonesiensis]